MKAHSATSPKGAGLAWSRVLVLAAVALAFVVVVPAAQTRPAPSGSMKINGGALRTNGTAVTITSTFSTATQMRFSNSGGTYSAWEPYNGTKAWSLPVGDGIKTINGQYKSTGKAITKTASITLDATAPTTTDDYDGVTRKLVTITLAPSDALSGVALTEYRVDGGGWVSGTSVTLRKLVRHKCGGYSSGPHTVDYRSTDGVGNVEMVSTVTVTL